MLEWCYTVVQRSSSAPPQHPHVNNILSYQYYCVHQQAFKYQAATIWVKILSHCMGTNMGTLFMAFIGFFLRIKVLHTLCDPCLTIIIVLKHKHRPATICGEIKGRNKQESHSPEHAQYTKFNLIQLNVKFDFTFHSVLHVLSSKR